MDELSLLPLVVMYLYKVRWVIDRDFSGAKYFNLLYSDLLNHENDDYTSIKNYRFGSLEDRVRFNQNYKISCMYTALHGFFVINKIDVSATNNNVVDTAFLLIEAAFSKTSKGFKAMFFETIKEISEKIRDYSDYKTILTIENQIINKYVGRDAAGNWIETELSKKYSPTGLISNPEAKRIPSIFDAIIYNELDNVQEYLIKGIDINVKNENGDTPLIVACDYKNYEIIEYLLSKGADVDARNDFGASSLHTLVNNQLYSNVLFNKNIHVSWSKEYLERAKLVQRCDYKKILLLLLRYNANINLEDKEGKKFYEIKEILGDTEGAVKLEKELLDILTGLGKLNS